MNTLHQVEVALEAQQLTWLESTAIWSDFSSNLEEGMRMHREAIEDDFLQENDVVDRIEVNEENAELIGQAMEARTECLLDTLVNLDLK